jgi:hypothetical protein
MTFVLTYRKLSVLLCLLGFVPMHAIQRQLDGSNIVAAMTNDYEVGRKLYVCF